MQEILNRLMQESITALTYTRVHTSNQLAHSVSYSSYV